MPIQVNGALRRAPCPVPSCPACEPNTGSVHPNLPAKADRVERRPTLLCNQVKESSTCPVDVITTPASRRPE